MIKEPNGDLTVSAHNRVRRIRRPLVVPSLARVHTELGTALGPTRATKVLRRGRPAVAPPLARVHSELGTELGPTQATKHINTANTAHLWLPPRWSKFTGNLGRSWDRPRSQERQPGRLEVAPFTGLGPQWTQDGVGTDPGGLARHVSNVSSVRCAEEQGAPEHAGKASPSTRTDLRRPTQPTASHNCCT